MSSITYNTQSCEYNDTTLIKLDTIRSLVQKSKTKLIFNSINKTKKNLLKNLKTDNFPRPMNKSSETISDSTTDAEEDSKYTNFEKSFNS